MLAKKCSSSNTMPSINLLMLPNASIAEIMLVKLPTSLLPSFLTHSLTLTLFLPLFLSLSLLPFLLLTMILTK